MPEERLQKIISRAGVASRRHAEQLILEGRVRVNGKVVTELGTKADLEHDHVKVDGKLLHAPKRLVYLALNKPVGYVTTLSDPQERKTVVELLRGVKERVYPVGRLDYNSEGLILFTNDGDFANRVMSKSSGVVKTYAVKVNGRLTEQQEEQFRNGVYLEGKKTAPAGLRLHKPADNPWYEVKLTEGRQNQIRLMFRHFGLLVEKLKRVQIAFLKCDVKPGEYRMLEPAELTRFRRLLRMEDAEHGKAPRDDS